MGSLLVRGKYLLPMSQRNPEEFIADAAVYIHADKIEDLGSYSIIKKRYPKTAEIGSDKHIILPGLINSHNHGWGITPFQMGVLDDFLEIWKPALMIRQKIDPYLDTLYACIKAIESGVTTNVHFDSYRDVTNYRDDILAKLRAYEDCGLRVYFGLNYKDQNQFIYDNDEKFLKMVPVEIRRNAKGNREKNYLNIDEFFLTFGQLCKKFSSASTIKFFFAPATTQSVSHASLQKIREKASEYETGIHLHTLETIYQRSYGARKIKKSIISYLNELGLLGPRTALVHGLWVTDKDLDIVTKTQTSIVHNPSSNLRLRSGIAPLYRMIEKGINVAIGIDSNGLNDDEDFFQEIRLCSRIQNVPFIGSPSIPSYYFLKMATLNGSKVTMFNDMIGTIERGKKADLILVDYSNMCSPFSKLRGNIFDNLIYRGKAENVDVVIIDGKIIMKNRKIISINKDAIVHKLSCIGEVYKQLNAKEKRYLEKLNVPLKAFYKNWRLTGLRPYYIHNSRS